MHHPELVLPTYPQLNRTSNRHILEDNPRVAKYHIQLDLKLILYEEYQLVLLSLKITAEPVEQIVTQGVLIQILDSGAIHRHTVWMHLSILHQHGCQFCVVKHLAFVNPLLHPYDT